MGKFTGRVSLDYETFSELDIRQVGAGRYSRHHSTEVLMLAYAYGDEPVEQWVPAHGERMPRDLRDMLRDPSIQKSAWNASFERQITANVLGIDVPFEQWRDPMVLAHSLSFPGALEKVGQIVGLSEDKAKMARGKALIRMFCGYRKPTKAKPWNRATHENEPEQWEEFLEYNRRDVDAERAVERKIRKWDMPEWEWDLWHLDQRINEAGIPVNMAMVHNAIRIATEVKEQLLDRMAEITGLENPNSGPQLLPWLQGQGYPYADLKKGHIKKALQSKYDEIDAGGNDIADIVEAGPYLEVLELRQETAKTSVTKYDALARAVDDDGVLRNAFQFAGAQRTWRWGGRVFQPQNLPRPAKYIEPIQPMAARHVETLDAESIKLLYDRPLELLSSTIRPAVQAPPGKTLADADLNAIENRVLGWISDCQKILNVFREGRCPYLDFATYMYKQSYDDLNLEYLAGNKGKRTIAKPAVLGCFGPDTEVLTDSGWKKIIHVTTSDKVFDGVEFVAHGGVVDQGEKSVIELAGVRVTPDHKVLTESGWEPAWRLKSDRRLMRRALSLAAGSFSGLNTEKSARGTETRPPSVESSRRVKPQSRWWRSKGPAEGLTVYDIAFAGPRSRFVIRTDRGPLIVHNCGYMLSAGEWKEDEKTGEEIGTGLLGYAADMGVQMTQEESAHAVSVFRETFEEVKQFWWDLDAAVRSVIATGKPKELRMFVIDRSGPFLRIRLPSGRHLHYLRPKLLPRKTPWGAMKMAITYEGLNDKKKWGRITTHPGKLTENVDQAIARDLLAHGMKLAHREGLDIRLHVHDQITALVDEDTAEDDLKLLQECMADQPQWARGLPLAAEGFLSPVFIKD